MLRRGGLALGAVCAALLLCTAGAAVISPVDTDAAVDSEVRAFDGTDGMESPTSGGAPAVQAPVEAESRDNAGAFKMRGSAGAPDEAVGGDTDIDAGVEPAAAGGSGKPEAEVELPDGNGAATDNLDGTGGAVQKPEGATGGAETTGADCESRPTCGECLGDGEASPCMWKASLTTGPQCVPYTPVGIDPLSDEWSMAPGGRRAGVNAASVLRLQDDRDPAWPALADGPNLCWVFSGGMITAGVSLKLQPAEGDGIDCSDRGVWEKNLDGTDDLWFRCMPRTHGRAEVGADNLQTYTPTLLEVPRGALFWHGTKDRTDSGRPVFGKAGPAWLGDKETALRYGYAGAKFTPAAGRAPLRLLELGNVENIKMMVAMFRESEDVRAMLGENTYNRDSDEVRMNDFVSSIQGMFVGAGAQISYMQTTMWLMDHPEAEFPTALFASDRFKNKWAVPALSRFSMYAVDYELSRALCSVLRENAGQLGRVDGYANGKVIGWPASYEDDEQSEPTAGFHSEIMVCDATADVEQLPVEALIDGKPSNVDLPDVREK